MPESMNKSEFGNRCAEQHRRLTAYVYAVCGDYHLAEDICQEALTIAFSKREHYFPEADFGAWLRAIARNIWMKERSRFSRRIRPFETIEDMADDLFPQQMYRSNRWEREKEALTICLGKLADPDRQLIDGHFKSGLKYADLASRFKRTLSWVKVRMHRARKILADCVQRQLGTEGAEHESQ